MHDPRHPLLGGLLAALFASAAGGEVVPSGPPERGYVADETCGRCHAELYRSYQDVGMARSFATDEAAAPIEDVSDAAGFLHEPSGRRYRMRREAGGGLVFRRWQEDAAGGETNVVELPVDFVLGSGHTSRTYLFRTPAGELYQLPVAWYTQEDRWAMAPGYDSADHDGLRRLVRRECMFCHNAYPPEVPPGSDRRTSPHLFPATLPAGTGCQRCHGPGARHVDAAVAGAGPELLRSSIVNPARLAGRRRHEVCYQCHLQPSVALMPVRRFDRGDYSYTPDQPIDDYVVYFDPLEADQPREARFEINHHPYRLEQSLCFEASDGALGCTTCHDPHRKVPPPERAAHYRAACLSCHDVSACDLEAMTAAGDADPAWAAVDPGDCVACHMPRRRTQDVVHVAMTDHRIRRRPGGPELLAPREERTPVLVDMAYWDAARAVDGPLGEVYRAIAVLRAGDAATAVPHLERWLPAATGAGADLLDAWYDLARGQLGVGRAADADTLLGRLLADAPDDPALLRLRALARHAQGDADGAVALLRRSLEGEPDGVEALYYLGRLLAESDPAEAELHLRRSAELRPVAVESWNALGELAAARERFAAAADAYRRALAVEPADTAAYLGLARALVAAGDRDGAVRVLRHGARWAARPAAVAALLAELAP